jgi:hypothetical protein
VHVPVGDLDGRLAVVGLDAGEHLVEHDARRVDVRAGSGDAALDLLGREVGDRAHQDAAGCGVAGVPADRTGQPEVRDLDPVVVGEQDVLGLDVAVHDPGLMGGAQGRQHRLHHLEGLPRAEVAALTDQVAQRTAADELHREEHVPLVGALVVDRDHVGVGEPGR